MKNKPIFGEKTKKLLDDYSPLFFRQNVLKYLPRISPLKNNT